MTNSLDQHTANLTLIMKVLSKKELTLTRQFACMFILHRKELISILLYGYI
jgi:hypothetical protein